MLALLGAGALYEAFSPKQARCPQTMKFVTTQFSFLAKLGAGTTVSLCSRKLSLSLEP